MRRVIFTESQINTILMSESAYPLDIKGDDGRPDNFTEYETVVNNAYVGTGDDVNTDVTTSDQIKRCKKGWFGLHTTTNDYRLAEGDELDNAKTSGYGKKNDMFINSVSKNLGGKMVSNLNAEINSNKGGSRNNTNQVRVSRMEKQKKEDPVTFQKNGGQKTVAMLPGTRTFSDKGLGIGGQGFLPKRGKHTTRGAMSGTRLGLPPTPNMPHGAK